MKVEYFPVPLDRLGLIEVAPSFFYTDISGRLLVLWHWRWRTAVRERYLG